MATYDFTNIRSQNIQVADIDIGVTTPNNGDVLYKVSPTTVGWKPIPQLFTFGVSSPAKIWSGAIDTATGSAVFNISSAGFSTLSSTHVYLETSNSTLLLKPVISAKNVNSITVNVYNTSFTGVVVLGINILGSVNTTLYNTGIVSVNLTVFGI